MLPRIVVTPIQLHEKSRIAPRSSNVVVLKTPEAAAVQHDRTQTMWPQSGVLDSLNDPGSE